MPESSLHMSLVNKLHNWTIENYHDYLPAWIDSPKFRKSMSQISINNYVTDFYARKKNLSNQVILGEAKTPADLDNRHSEEQISSFLKHSSLYQDSIFLLAIPWDYAACARNFLRYLKHINRLDNVQSLVVDLIEHE